MLYPDEELALAWRKIGLFDVVKNIQLYLWHSFSLDNLVTSLRSAHYLK